MHHSKSEDPGNGLVAPSGTGKSEERRGSVQSAATSETGPLGITAKSSTPPDHSVGMRDARLERYVALSRARVWLGRRANLLHPDKQFPGDVYRTFDCRHVRTAMRVGVHYRDEFRQAHYRGIATCGSVWACPVCASVIQERRRMELEHLVEWSDSQGYQAIMVTFTFPHASFHSLADLLDQQADAFRRFRSGSPFTRLKKSLGFRGLVRSLEVTHGVNGWHPHTHELWLVDQSVAGECRQRLIELWERACIASGLLDPLDQVKVDAFRRHSVDVKFNATSGQYLAKQDSSRTWGITHEVAKATSKAGKAKGVHPHEFLVRAGRGDRSRFFEYLDGMKGRRQLFWSPGLKASCGLADIDDQAVADDAPETGLLGSLVEEEWEFIRTRRVVAQVLDAAELGGWDAVLRYLRHLGYQGPPPLEFP